MIWIVVSIFLIGCNQKTKEFIFAKIEKKYSEKKYSQVLELITEIEELDPLHELKKITEYKAFSLYETEQYKEAGVIFYILLTKYQENKNNENLKLIILNNYFKIIHESNNLSTVYQALDYLDEFAPEYEKSRQELKNIISKNHIHKTSIFLEYKKNFISALWSLANAVNDEDTNNIEIAAEGYFRIIEIFEASKNEDLKADAEKIYNLMQENFPNSEWTIKAKKFFEF